MTRPPCDQCGRKLCRSILQCALELVQTALRRGDYVRCGNRSMTLRHYGVRVLYAPARVVNGNELVPRVYAPREAVRALGRYDRAELLKSWVGLPRPDGYDLALERVQDALLLRTLSGATPVRWLCDLPIEEAIP